MLSRLGRTLRKRNPVYETVDGYTRIVHCALVHVTVRIYVHIHIFYFVGEWTGNGSV